MPNLVGIGLSQVPTNSMLGGLAYQDPEHASIKDLDLKNLSQINSEISDTAVDVFIYDTSKDSDGGAWRKRTQHTSWYNETLNTATRGSRKEFPAVAVLVLEGTKLTIYDGDDPDLPMWMKFEASGGSWNDGVLPAFNGYRAISALNGTICVASTGNSYGLIKIQFISDDAYSHTTSTNYGGYDSLGLSQRNSSGHTFLAGSGTVTLGVLVNNNLNDVSMTVLTNAPIDDASGLPTPTIAVATDGGLSVIKDDGTVVDMYPTGSSVTPAKEIYFTESNNIAFRINNNWTYYYPIPSDDTTSTYWNGLEGFIGRFTDNQRTWATNGIPINVGSNGITKFLEDRAIGHTNGLDIIDINEGGPLGQGMHAGISTDFNTGYQVGDIKGAFLSDTDTTDATYTTVADDWATAGAWTKQSSISLTSTGSGTSGTVTITGNGTGSNVYFFNPITVEANTDYVVTITFGAYSATDFYINNTQYATINQVLDIHGQSGLIRGGHFNSGSNTTLYIQGYQVSTNATTITNVVVQKVSERDRSVNNKGLQVYGTIPKSAVATGAELVGYSFSSGNYLEQPYNSDLNFGTGDFSVTVWIKPSATGSQQSILNFLSTNSSNVTQDGFYLVHYNGTSGNWYFGTYEDGAVLYTSLSLGSIKSTNKWYCLHVNKIGTTAYLYQNGVFIGSGTVKSDLTINSADQSRTSLVIGKSKTSGLPLTGSLSLFRISSSTPSAEQIKKIYEDEKVLFQENAKATLYGSSDAVTALGYDEDTELLHVGTSSGRSDFQGLGRINNTTTAVTTAISASDELIAEQ